MRGTCGESMNPFSLFSAANQKADPVSESANPSSQHQLDGSIVPIWTERRKMDLGWLWVIRLGCISPSAYYLHKMLQEQ